MNLEPLRNLAREWAQQATRLREWGAPRQASVLEHAAEELEQRLNRWWYETLPVPEAAREADLHPSTLHKRIQRGELEDVGGEGSVRVRRCDLFGSPAQESRPETDEGEPDVASEVLARLE